jgi:hypothetical protein
MFSSIPAISNPVITPPAETVTSEGRDEKRVPRYVQLPALREHGMGPRNLFWGVALLFLALVMLIVAVFFSGAKAMVYVATCLLTFTAIFVLARMHIFRQRNGPFLALGLVCVIGTAIPLVEKAYTSAKGLVASRATGQASPAVASHMNEGYVPLLTESFAVSAPQGDGKQVKVLTDSRVVIDDKPFFIKAGDRFPLIAVKGDETSFAVRDLHISLPSNTVEVIDPKAVAKGVTATASAASAAPATTAPAEKAPAKSGGPVDDATLAEITRAAQQEAMRRYPALAIKDSLENAMFISTYKQLRDAGSDDFFSNPEWPMELADLLAKREGWNKGGSPITTGPAPVLDAPDDVPAAAPVAPAAPAARQPVNLPPVDSLDAGSDLPRAGRSAR